ncbi:MAG: hypothetical protein AAF528_02885 [Cyanobacteria bacterium P01_C01_bin.121]
MTVIRYIERKSLYREASQSLMKRSQGGVFLLAQGYADRIHNQRLKPGNQAF